MCLFNTPDMPPVQKPVPPPPPPPPAEDHPTAPVFNEGSTASQNATNAVAAKRLGTRALTIPLGGASGSTGLQIPN